ncbi:ABC transporter ATP-binding protein [Dactylosporangium sp. CA-092794]|uniref:ABC transporter ATP-binding protein n=1 Tax=Dactylosporangium sp. CA-092794 TaxID=3239929 RepID=UPI003D8DA8D5
MTDPTPSVLQVTGLKVTYPGGGVGLAAFDLEVGAGEVVALLGRNGAGKTTALRGISGYLKSEGVQVAGSVTVRGRQVARLAPYQCFGHGVSYVPERDKVFPVLSVEEHLRLNRHDAHRVDAVFEQFPRLAKHRKRQAVVLSGGERQMLALAMAWMAQPAVLLVDEASLGLSPVAIEAVTETLDELRARLGVALVLVDQETSHTLTLAERIVILQQGGIVWQGRRGDISSDDLRSIIVGSRDDIQ